MAKRGGFFEGFRTLLQMPIVDGVEHYHAVRGPAVYLADTASAQDVAFVGAMIPGALLIDQDMLEARRTYALFNISIARLALEKLKAGKSVVVFVQSQMVRQPQPHLAYESAGFLARKAGVPLVPVQLSGLERTKHSLRKPYDGVLEKRARPYIVFGPSARLPRFGHLAGQRLRRAEAAFAHDLVARLTYERFSRFSNVLEGVREAAFQQGEARTIIRDMLNPAGLTYKKLLIGAAVIGAKIEANTAQDEVVGLMLPTATGAAVAFLGCLWAERVPAMLNYTAGAANVLAACRTAQIGQVLTSRAFVEKANLQALVEALSAEVEVIYLEDVRASLSPFDKVKGLLTYKRPLKRGGDDTAVILFTSGSEGAPKGVALSHRNLLSNAAQAFARVDVGPWDHMFNALPVFHSFGLLAGIIVPLVRGFPTFLYPSPLHYKAITDLVRQKRPTIFLSTDTFLKGMAQVADSIDFASVRYIVAGAEALKKETRALWRERFGKDIFEGYGVTETAPVVAVNTRIFSAEGTVGRLMPHMDYVLEPVEGITLGGRLLLRGPNVMKGYIRPEEPGVIVPPEQGWFDTGDICTVDDFGFIRIVGRAKRFAKIGGEMVSLSAAEQLFTALVGEEAKLGIVALPDPKKGERLVAVTTTVGLSRTDFVAHAKGQGAQDLMVPHSVLTISDADFPLLGSGKTNYPALNEWVKAQVSLAA
jgi:acyl-[acyl-carrier-protein]-phospholipid O-acyltransferase / long-chain-fatty-acid--[acyl-carrier-protein] ligase